jgi:hypothetical protein
LFQDVAFALFDVSLICSCKTNSDKCRLDEDYQSIKIFKPPFYIQNSLFVNFSDNLASITPETKNFCHFDFGIIYLGSGNNFFMVENILQSGNFAELQRRFDKMSIRQVSIRQPIFLPNPRAPYIYTQLHSTQTLYITSWACQFLLNSFFHSNSIIIWQPS